MLSVWTRLFGRIENKVPYVDGSIYESDKFTIIYSIYFYDYYSDVFPCRSTLQYTSSQTPFLPTRNNLQKSSVGSAGGTRGLHGFSEKNFTQKCSWRCIAIFFVVLAFILSAALAYITGKLL